MVGQSYGVHGQDKDLEQYPLPDQKPVEFNQNRCGVFIFSSSGDETGNSILDTLLVP